MSFSCPASAPTLSMFQPPQFRMGSILTAAIVLLVWPITAGSDTLGAVKLFSDNECTQLTKSISSLSVDSCFNVNEVVAISVLQFPRCTNGQATLYLSDQKQCGRPSIWPMTSTNTVGECLSFSTGAEIESAAFECSSSDESPSDSTAASSAPATKESQVQGTESPTPTSFIPQATTSTELPSATSTGTPTKGSGLAQSDKIAIAVGLSVGIAGLIIAAVTLKYTRQAAVGTGEPPPPYSRY